jgi:hypothetical protein
MDLYVLLDHLFVDIPQPNNQIYNASDKECCRKSVFANGAIQLQHVGFLDFWINDSFSFYGPFLHKETLLVITFV